MLSSVTTLSLCCENLQMTTMYFTVEKMLDCVNKTVGDKGLQNTAIK